MNALDLTGSPHSLGKLGNGLSIGAILVNANRLTSENAERILQTQKVLGKRFGEAAIELGLLTHEDIRFALSNQYDYPYLPKNDTSLSRELFAAYAPFSKPVEQLRALRSQLILRWFNTTANRKTLAIVSPSKGEGRSFIAANLAIVFSQLGARTLLIDADLRKPKQHQLFKLQNEIGLSSVLANRAGLEAVERVTSLLALSVLPAGPIPPNPQELLGRSSFSEVLSALIGSFDIIIIDTPPGIESADAQIVAARAQAAILIARKNKSLVPLVTKLSRDIQELGTNLIGSIINDG